ncbi:hypothetical protein [Lamprobacter modestohalophilus]|nr:hypothetical protein [Lamprobacter modestohalophilus]
MPFALVDLTACYPPEAGVTQVWRALWWLFSFAETRPPLAKL